jgi:hypothetical protein
MERDQPSLSPKGNDKKHQAVKFARNCGVWNGCYGGDTDFELAPVAWQSASTNASQAAQQNHRFAWGLSSRAP